MFQWDISINNEFSQTTSNWKLASYNDKGWKKAYAIWQTDLCDLYWLSYTQSGDAITSKSKKDGHKHEISLVKIKSNQVLLYINPWIIPTYVFLVSTSAVAD